MITGKLNFHSETGTEGGYYAIQNSDHISHIVPEFGVFEGHTVYDPQDLMRSGKVIEALRDDGTPFTSAPLGEVALLDIQWNDNVEEIARPSNTVRIERWSYEGLEYLEDGDKLTIFAQGIGSVALWKGTVSLLPQDSYGEDSYAPFGFACHHRPLNTEPVTEDEWSEWFFEQRFATLDRTGL